ncbi:Acetate/butyrate--CoA ligase AAE7, peroxisomal; AltName: Full=AMP-binding protein 7; Short=AtAMPBP7; AltName: Full=Acetyl-CoA synthetase; AltName: Full=Acyl-activating enzyme 7; AltName: Full=Butyryl-CoA synthetase; AltName: Full=Protein ACETATE NON-UTILIZING 1 [Serendipita indica DSM 11827]|nr:Acetate/butyrate--CoA ligase AAE7, peroxisomal; AltName: Full=AMP-binding protein 7; Short=AtAMPBP7; AltName: Full=Acetyl-CoA synthetase; AltName: Full=Acyl-activating enzyme 7; AltName: Full=Butyryl-CoA synthetase; AltName: Full=Protein ACETATE NON-UTILIZING 1 [Serendipita indica DSM 11827]
MSPLEFQPTPESIPPPNVQYRLQLAPSTAVNYTPLNPISFILRAALIYPNHVALSHRNVATPVEYTYAVWAQRVQNLAYGLIKAGIEPGDRVAVIAPNYAHNGVLAARAVLVCINTRLVKSDIEYILSHSGAKLVLVDHEYAGLVKDCPVPVIVSRDTGRAGDPYETFLSEGRRFSRERGWAGLQLEEEETANATLNYTSGTTGRPKGVMATLRGSYLAAISNAYESKLNINSVYLWVLPMFHASGWTYPWALTFAMAKQVTIRTVDYKAIWGHFLYSGVTHYCGAPTVQISIVNSPEAKRLKTPITAVIAGAAPTAALLEALENLNFQVNHVYGLTLAVLETYIPKTYGPFTRNYDRPEYKSLGLEERARILSRQGHAFAQADEVRVVQIDEEGKRKPGLIDCDFMQPGEIVTRGNIYYRDPKATEEAFRGGYFATGDVAVKFPDGSISIRDRSKDLIISGGENASSLAIEQELSLHPDVLEVSVVARKHEKWGERAMAFVILHQEAVQKWKGREDEFQKDLINFVKGKLPGFAQPAWVECVSELPKTSTGKIQKTVLRQRAAKL